MIHKWMKPGWTLHTLQTSTDGWGNVTEDWSTGTAVSGRFRPLSGDRRLSADKHDEFADAKFYCSADVSVSVGDQLRRDDDHYEVKFVQNPMDMDRFLQVELRKL